MAIWHNSEARKNWENVFNDNTLKALYTLADQGVFDVLHGVVKDGKESRVCVAEADDTLLAVKLYTVEASSYEDLQQYLVGDPRFDGITTDRRSIVHHWCTKEFKNLQIAQEAGVRVPEPVAFEENVLVMEFIGTDYEPAPHLRDVELGAPERVLDDIIGYMQALWEEGLVHADLSPFNVLWDDGPVLIDLSQAVLTAHPRADAFLERDVEHVLDHFRRRYDLDRDPVDIRDRVRSS